MCTYLVFFSIIAFVGRVSLSQPCICSTCGSEQTVGELYNRKCFYIEDDTSSSRIKSHLPVTNIINAQQLEIFHRVTRRFYKTFLTSQFSLRLNSTKFVNDYFRLPSVPFHKLMCPVYDIESNILYDEYNSCITRPVYSVTTSYKVVPNTFSEQQFCGKTYECFQLKELGEPCNLFGIRTNNDYKKVEQFAMYHKNDVKGFLVKFDQESVSLNKSDYFMHVSSINKYKSPFSSHYVDVEAGKIFQVFDDKRLSDVLLHDEKQLCYNDMKQMCSLQACV